MRFLIAGGGTGGHVYPGVTIAQAIRDRLPEAEIVFVGTRQGIEADIVPREGFHLETISLAGLPRKLSPRTISALWLAARGLCEACRIVSHFRPDVAIGTGGYVCGPVILAAALACVPCAIQEQNAIPGLTNRLLGRLARRIFLAYEEAERYFDPAKVVRAGNPIRSSVTEVSRAAGAARLSIDPNLFTLLVVGASQGARSINQALLAGLPTLMMHPCLQMVHVTGKRNFTAVKEAMIHLNLAPAMAARVHTEPYLYNIADAYAAADLVVSRAGAIGLAEMTACGLPLILVPLPQATANHQALNARALEMRGAARVIPDHELCGDRLTAEVLSLVHDRSALGLMKRASLASGRVGAAQTIVSVLIDLAGEIRPGKRGGR